jgi:hypothetical protein
MTRPQSARFIAGRNRRAYSAQDIDVEKAQPVGIGDIFERLGFEDAQIVDQDFHIRMAPRQFVGRGGRAQVAREARHVTAGFRFHASHRFIHRRLRTAIDDHARAFLRQSAGDGVADAGGAAADQRQLAFQLQIHMDSFRCLLPRFMRMSNGCCLAV